MDDHPLWTTDLSVRHAYSEDASGLIAVPDAVARGDQEVHGARERVPGCDVTSVEPPEHALAEALEAATRDGGAVVVAGSLYLVGAARASLASRGLIA